MLAWCLLAGSGRESCIWKGDGARDYCAFRKSNSQKDHSVIMHIITFTYEKFPAPRNRALVDSNWLIRSRQIARANCQTCRGQAFSEAHPEHSGAKKNGPISPDGLSSISYEERSLSRHITLAQCGSMSVWCESKDNIAYPFLPAPRKALFIPFVQLICGPARWGRRPICAANRIVARGRRLALFQSIPVDRSAGLLESIMVSCQTILRDRIISV